MATIDVIPCIVDDGDVRRPYPGETPQFYGAYQKDTEGLSQHVVDFYCMDFGYGYHNDPYAVVFWLEGDGQFLSVSMTSFGMPTKKWNLPKGSLDTILARKRRSFVGGELIVPYESLPEPVQRQIRHECLQHVDQLVTA